MNMKVIEVRTFGGPEVLTLAERDIPEPGVGEVLVKVHAIGVNPVETYIRSGTYPRLPELPYVPGGNVAGEIVRCGDGVEGWNPGDRVYSSATISGGYAEYALCAADAVFGLPERVTFDAGAAIGVPAATAWRALFLRGKARAGEKVLIHGGSGSVGQAAIQLGKAAGLFLSATAGTARGCEKIAMLGAKPFDHNAPDYLERLAAEGEGFDLIVEMLANKNLAADLELLAPGGRVVIVGSRGPIEIDPRATMGKESEIRGLAVFNSTPEETRMTHAALAAALEAGILDPAIAAVMPLAEAARAHHQVMQDGNCGKILLHP